jgi:8-oxo-dGTP pyrophosphatase MutT (NUDIX family)
VDLGAKRGVVQAQVRCGRAGRGINSAIEDLATPTHPSPSPTCCVSNRWATLALSRLGICWPGWYSHRVPHIHEKIDFTVAIFVVREGRVLLVHHRALDKWLPLGGHIELDEDPEQAAVREAREESGLEVELLGERPPTTGPGTRALIAPRFLDIHRISETHEHIGMIYWARPRERDGGKLGLSNTEHHDIRWCPAEDLDGLRPSISQAVSWYCRKAIEEVSGSEFRLPSLGFGASGAG